MQHAFALFETTIGRCAVAWTELGIAAVRLPAGRDLQTRAALFRRFPQAIAGEPPLDVQRAIDAMVALLRGEPQDLSWIELDTTGVPPFHQRVYNLVRSITPGTTQTYGEVARRLGVPGSARAVGQAMGRNPFPIIVPCHRVVAAGGGIGGFSAYGGAVTKRKLLAIEAGNGATT